MNTAFTAHNELEEKLVAAQSGQLDTDTFMKDLIDAQVFMPVEDEKSEIQGFQKSTRANPLRVTSEDGEEVLILFTSPDRSKEFIRDFPNYNGGLLTELKWILERIGAGVCISINPGLEVGIDFDAQTVEQLIHLAAAQAGVPSDSPAS